MGRFISPGQAQRFLSVLEPIRGHFHPHRHQLTASEYRETMSQPFESWEEVTCQDIAAKCMQTVEIGKIAQIFGNVSLN